MILSGIRLQDFGCFVDFELTDLSRLSVVIGENDAGKTVLLDAIEVLLDNKAFDSERHPRQTIDESVAEKVIVEGEFELESHDTLPEEFRSGPQKNTLFIRKEFSDDSVDTYVKGRGYSDEKLDRFSEFRRKKQQEILEEYGLEPEGREENRLKQREELVEQGKVEHKWKIRPVPFSTLRDHLPDVERTSSTNYKSPNRMVSSTLKRVAATVVTPENEDGEPKERKELQPVREDIEDRLEKEIQKAENELQRQHPQIKGLGVDPEIDFTNVVQDVSITVDTGGGEKRIGSFGEGTKKRVWMGLLEWDREATSESARESTIRLYDEPDLNLHYEAQQRLFNNVSALAEDEDAKTQCFVCTHSVFFIDRAPPESINLIEVGEDRQRNAQYIDRAKANTDGVVDFFDQIGRAVGLSNTSLLYEKGFLVVEGTCEEEALPILYHKLYDSSLSRDGLRIVNLKTCGAWKSVLSVLLANRLEMIHLLLDSDCTSSDTLKLTPEALEDDGVANCPDDLFDQRTTFIGDKEFEDAFADDVYVRALNSKFERADGDDWETSHIQDLREEDKFSVALENTVFSEAREKRKNDARKPQIARAVATQCAEDEIPDSLIEAFDTLRQRAGID